MTLLPWEELEEGPLDQRRVFAVRADKVRSQKTGKTFTVDRLFAPDWVNIVAVTEQDELVLVRQWRFGARAFTLELPAGLLEKGEDPAAGALRELREETGHAPVEGRAEDAPRVLCSCLPNPAFMGNRCTTIFAPRVKRVGEQQLDPMEEVEIVVVPRAEVERMVDAGELGTALGLVGILMWLRGRQ